MSKPTIGHLAIKLPKSAADFINRVASQTGGKDAMTATLVTPGTGERRKEVNRSVTLAEIMEVLRQAEDYIKTGHHAALAGVDVPKPDLYGRCARALETLYRFAMSLQLWREGDREGPEAPPEEPPFPGADLTFQAILRLAAEQIVQNAGTPCGSADRFADFRRLAEIAPQIARLAKPIPAKPARQQEEEPDF